MPENVLNLNPSRTRLCTLTRHCSEGEGLCQTGSNALKFSRSIV